MSPKDYMNDMRRDAGGILGVLTPRQQNEASELLDVGYRFIGRKLSEHYDDMTPEASDYANLLVAFLATLVEHASNISLLRSALKKKVVG